MCVDLDSGPVGISTGWPNRTVTQQTQSITSTTSSLVQPWTSCVLHVTHRFKQQHKPNEEAGTKNNNNKKGLSTFLIKWKLSLY